MVEKPLFIPKLFLTGIRVPGGPYSGQLARPCPCGMPVDLDTDSLYLVERSGEPLTFWHAECIGDS